MLKKIEMKKLLMLSAVFALSACGDSNTSNQSSGGSNPLDPFPNLTQNQPQLVANQFLNVSDLNKIFLIPLVYNGFNLTKAQYEALSLPQTPSTLLAADLSVTQTKNVYFKTYYDDALKKKVAGQYSFTLPGSGETIQTPQTILNPNLSMHHVYDTNSEAKTNFPIIPSPTKPVVLSIPAGLAATPEAPFFPATAQYTGVVAMYDATPGAPNHSATFSIEARARQGVKFGAFGHYPGKDITIRLYDAASTLETPTAGREDYVLLSQTTQTGTINARFLNLTSDGLPNNLNLKSLTLDELKALGHVSGAGYKHWMILPILHEMFPHLLEKEGSGAQAKLALKYNHEFGVFCLGGANNFQKVVLNDRTFLYPMSAATKNTQIQRLTVDATSGVMAETGKHVTITTLSGSGTLTVIPILTDASKTDAIINVTTKLEGVTSLKTTLGYVDPSYALPTGGVVLLEHTNNAGAITTPIMEDTHSGGVAYDGEVEYKDKKLTLISLNKKGKVALGSGAVTRLMAHHPNTQGQPLSHVLGLSHTLDPVLNAQHSLNTLNSLLISNLATPSVHTQLTNAVSVSLNQTQQNLAGALSANWLNLGATTIGSNLQFAQAAAQNSAWGAEAIATQKFAFNGLTLTPYLAAGYMHYALKNQSLHAYDIDLHTSNLSAHAATFKCAVLSEFAPAANTTLKFSAGLQHQIGQLLSGHAYMLHDSTSLAGEPLNGLSAFVAAEFNVNTNFIKIGLFNVNNFSIEFGFSH